VVARIRIHNNGVDRAFGQTDRGIGALGIVLDFNSQITHDPREQFDGRVVLANQYGLKPHNVPMVPSGRVSASYHWVISILVHRGSPLRTPTNEPLPARSEYWKLVLSPFRRRVLRSRGCPKPLGGGTEDPPQTCLRRMEMKQFFRHLWTEQNGQDVAEYAMMLAVVLVIVMGTVRLIGSNSGNIFSQVGSSLQ
jgi:Flp pilus assembly pilin Flp